MGDGKMVIEDGSMDYSCVCNFVNGLSVLLVGPVWHWLLRSLISDMTSGVSDVHSNFASRADT